ncbi:MAG: M48 family metallopeptidase [archaeon]|nr:M48 family metallopeptidase [archaeon]
MVKPQERISFHEQIARNKRKSIFLISLIIIVIIALAYVIGMVYGDPFVFLIFGTIIALIYVVGGYYGSAQLSIAVAGAKLADRIKYRQYYNLVEGLTLASGLPMPKLYIMENSQINAFASGRNPKNSVVCITTGALEKLDRRELEGVLSHELSHIANYDIRFMTLVAVLVGMIAIISEIFLRSLWFKSGDRDSGKGGAIILLIGIVLAILAPIFVQLIQLAISRKREYVADASAVKFTRSPTGLIGALKKIKAENINPKESKKIGKAIAPLFISNPFRNKDLTSTHPAIEKRIEILERM